MQNLSGIHNRSNSTQAKWLIAQIAIVNDLIILQNY